MEAIRQPVSRTWLQSPDQSDRSALLEYTRGVLYSFAFSRENDITRSRAIHVSRIQNAFAGLGAPSLYRLGLRLLHLFREIEPLFGGYWLLTPYRVIDIESHYAFVGAVPSMSGSLGDVRYAGLGRFISKEIASQFPLQGLAGWMGLSDTSIEKQVKDFVFSHHQQAKATLQADDIEYLKILGNDRHGRRFVWSQQPQAVLALDRIALCRQNHIGGYRYFSGELHNGTLTTEAPVVQPLTQIMFALANFVALPVTAKVREEVARTLFNVPERLPIDGYRLALLLATEISRQGYTTTYSVESSLAPALNRQLSALGCSLEILQ